MSVKSLMIVHCDLSRNSLGTQATTLSHRMFLLISFRKTIPPRNRQLTVYYFLLGCPPIYLCIKPRIKLRIKSLVSDLVSNLASNLLSDLVSNRAPYRGRRHSRRRSAPTASSPPSVCTGGGGCAFPSDCGTLRRRRFLMSAGPPRGGVFL